MKKPKDLLLSDKKKSNTAMKSKGFFEEMKA